MPAMLTAEDDDDGAAGAAGMAGEGTDRGALTVAGGRNGGLLTAPEDEDAATEEATGDAAAAAAAAGTMDSRRPFLPLQPLPSWAIGEVAEPLLHLAQSESRRPRKWG